MAGGRVVRKFERGYAFGNFHPISDQNMWFSQLYFRPHPNFHPISDQIYPISFALVFKSDFLIFFMLIKSHVSEEVN